MCACQYTCVLLHVHVLYLIFQLLTIVLQITNLGRHSESWQPKVGRLFRSRFGYVTVGGFCSGHGFWSRDMFYSSHEPHACGSFYDNMFILRQCVVGLDCSLSYSLM